MTRLRRIAAVGCVSVVASAACDTSSGGSDGGTDAQSAFDVTAAAQQYCETFYEQLQTCDKVSPAAGCLQLLANQCTQAYVQENLFSPVFFQAYVACPFPTGDCSCLNGSCDDASIGAAVAWTQCFNGQLASAPVSSALQKLHNDFCAVCPDGASKLVPDSCSSLIATSDAGRALDPSLKEYGDSVLADFDARCTGAALQDAGATDCFTAFNNCWSHELQELGANDASSDAAALEACLQPSDSGSGD